MKNVIAILTLCALAVQLQWGSGYLIDYFVDTDAYKELCENNNLPELNCNGQCVLAQKLQQHSSGQTTINVFPISFEFTFSTFLTSFQNLSFSKEKDEAIVLFNYSYLLFLRIFKPPS